MQRQRTSLNYLDISRLTTIEVEEYVKRGIELNGAAPIVIAIGATEQHGPTGLIGTDSQTSLAVARQVCEDCGVLLGPQLQVGMSLHHCGFAGSTSLRPSTLVNVICDIVWSLRQSSNLTHFYFINGHGGNVLPIKLAFAILRAKELPPWSASITPDIISASDTKLLLANKKNKLWSPGAATIIAAVVPEVTVVDTKVSLDLPGHTSSVVTTPDLTLNTMNTINSADTNINSTLQSTVVRQSPFKLEMVSWYANNESQALAKSLYGDELGQHATPDEVAITQFLFPEVIKTAVLDPEILKATPPGRTARRSEGGSNVESIISGLLEGITDVDERNKIMFLGKMALNHMDPVDFRKRFADGRMWSNPGLSTPEHGKLLFETSTKSVIESFKFFVKPEEVKAEEVIPLG